MAPSGVNDSVREMMSALKINWANVHGVDSSGALLSTAGTSTAYTLTFSTAPASLYTSFIFGCKIHTDCGAGPTINVNGLGAVNIQKMTTAGYANLAAGDLKQNQHPLLKYDGTLAKVILLAPTATAESGFADPMTTRGDIIVRNSSNVSARLPAGASGTALQSDGTDLAYVAAATSSEFRTGTDTTKRLVTSGVWGALAEVTLTDAATVAVDMATGFDFTVTLGGNRTLGNPTNVKVGQRGRIRVVQDGTGSRTLAFGGNYEFEDATAITLSSGAADEDILYYDCISATRILITGFVGNIG